MTVNAIMKKFAKKIWSTHQKSGEEWDWERDWIENGIWSSINADFEEIYRLFQIEIFQAHDLRKWFKKYAEKYNLPDPWYEGTEEQLFTLLGELDLIIDHLFQGKDE